MNKFIYQPHPVRIIFGDSIPVALERELPKDSISKIWIIASLRFESLVGEINDLTGVEVKEHFSRVLQHVPVDQVQKSRHAVAKSQPDILMPIGGGSAIGLAKAIALKHPLPIWAVPTTYSGSEMTQIYGISNGEKKEVGRHSDVIPSKVFYDPALSLSLPFGFAAKSAINALAHLIEAVYSVENNPFTYRQALDGIRFMIDGLTGLADKKTLTPAINETLLLGSSLAGKSLSEAEMALHHKSAHVLGGSYGLDHAGVHTVLLPYVFNYQWNSLPSAIKSDFIDLFSSETPPKELLRLIKSLGLPSTLPSIGFKKELAKSAAEKIVQLNFRNPAPVNVESVQTLFERACDGQLI